MTLKLPLERRPLIEQAGLSVHGYKDQETFVMRDLWGMHVYLYRGSLKVGDKGFDFGEGFVSVTPPNTTLTWAFPDHAPHYYAHFHFGDPLSVDDKRTEVPVLARYPRPFDQMVVELEELIGSVPTHRLKAEIRLWDILWRLPAHPTASELVGSESLHPTVQIATSIIENNLGRKLEVRRLAERVGVSHNHLTNLFRQSYGTTVVGFVRRRRSAKAAHLLTRSSLSIKSIAREVGIEDLHQFNKIIRKELGCSPTSYRIGGNNSQP